MADTAQLQRALIRAHEAGDAEGARALANALKAAQAPADTRPTDRGFGAAVAQGGTFGFADELRGALGAGLDVLGGLASPSQFGERYRDIRDQERAAYARYEEENPGSAMAGELLGGFGTGLVGGARAAGTQVGRKLAANIAARPVGQRAAIAAGAGAAGGAAGGALTGAGEAETLADVPGQAASSAAVGGLLGAAAGPLGEGLVTLGQKGLGAARRALAPSDEQRAAGQIRKALERQGQTPQEAAGRMAALGPGATLADTGQGTRGLLDAMATQPGETAEAAGRQLARRSRMQIDELTEAIGRGRAAEAIDASKVARQEQASPLYQQAFAEGVPHTDTLEDLFSRPAVKSAWSKAKRRGQDISGVDPARLGDVRPSLEGWQATKEALDDRVSALLRAGKNKEAREIQENILAPLLAELDSASPTYAAARNIWADSKSFDDAVEAGKKFIREPAGETERALARLTDADRDAYKIGAVQAIDDMLSAQGWTHDATKRFNTPKMQRKLQALLGPEEYVDFMNRLEASRVKQQTFGLVGKGSQTAARTAAREDESMTAALRDFGVDVLTGQSPTVAGVGRAAQMLKNLPVGGTPESARNLIGRSLLETDPQAVERLLLQAYAPRPPLVTQGAGLLPFAAGVPLGAGAGLLAAQ